MSIARKLVLNLGWRALLILGPHAYMRYLIAFLRNFRSIVRVGNFSPLDKVMSAQPIKVRMNKSEFIIDCPFTDQHVDDRTFTFGIVREMYIRNCYLRYGVSEAARNASIVLDLDANRGAFSIMMACLAKRVIAVEFNPLFKNAIVRNMAINGFTNYEIETAFIGEGGHGDDDKIGRTTIADLLNKYGIENVDLVKMDIEGSEFALFRTPEWLKRVSALCMEVHPEFGDPQEIITALEHYAFSFLVTDCEFRPVKDLKRAEFIYAWKPANG